MTGILKFLCCYLRKSVNLLLKFSTPLIEYFFARALPNLFFETVELNSDSK